MCECVNRLTVIDGGWRYEQGDAGSEVSVGVGAVVMLYVVKCDDRSLHCALRPDIDARPWAFKAEECALRASVDRFNERRYGDGDLDSEYRPVDNCLLSVLGPAVELSDEYKLNYERWLDQEVFGHQVNWDLMLEPC